MVLLCVGVHVVGKAEIELLDEREKMRLNMLMDLK